LSFYGWRKKKTRTKKPTTISALAIVVGYAKTIQMNLEVIKVAEVLGSCAKIHGGTKSRISFAFRPLSGSPEEENRQSEKTHSTLNISEASPLIFSSRFRFFFFGNKMHSVALRTLPQL
jgi:hypothetical protein